MEGTQRTLEELFVQRRKVTEAALAHIDALDLFHPSAQLSGIKKSKTKVSAFAVLLPTDYDLGELAKGKISIASTVTCIKSLNHCPDFQPDANADYSTLVQGLADRLANDNLRTSDLPHGNPFTIGLLLPILKTMEADPTSELVKKSIEFAEHAIGDGGVSIGNFPQNGYVTYWVLLGLETWGKEIGKYSKVLEWSRTEFYRQMSLFASGTDEKSDAFQLGYTFLIQYRYARSDLSEAVVKLALKTLFNAQLSRGVWEKKDPLFVYGQSGDAYCFSFELLNVVLMNLQNEIDLAEYEENLDRAFNWTQRNWQREKEFSLWKSGHRVDDTRPESWATAEIYLFFQLYRQLLSQRIQKILLNTLGGTYKGSPNPKAFEGFYIPNIRLPREADRQVRLDELLIERLLEPLKGDDGIYSLANHLDRSQRNRSGILFGPPGTGKTTFAKAVANYLGWPFVSLDPSDFAEEGFHLIPNTTSKLFKKLLELEDIVILFDEMEELIRKRSGDEAGTFEQKFLTTSLLPKLQYLYDRASCIFFVSTNFFDSIDLAAKREGRFDFHLQVVPPSFEEKLRMIKTEWVDVSDAVVKELEEEQHREKVLWATRMEMLVLIRNLKAEPNEARHILGRFRPLFFEDEEYKKKYMSESGFNLFNRGA